MFKVAIIGGGVPGIFIAKWLLNLGLSPKEICIVEPHCSVFKNDSTIDKIFALRSKRQRSVFEQMHQQFKPNEIVNNRDGGYGIFGWMDIVLAEKVIIASRFDINHPLIKSIEEKLHGKLHEGVPLVKEDLRWVQEVYIARMPRTLGPIYTELKWLEDATDRMSSAFRNLSWKQTFRRFVQNFY